MWAGLPTTEARRCPGPLMVLPIHPECQMSVGNCMRDECLRGDNGGDQRRHRGVKIVLSLGEAGDDSMVKPKAGETVTD